jgi:hypothetical protein
VPTLLKRVVTHPVTRLPVIRDVKGAAKAGVNRYALATSDRRVLPDFVLAGAQRCGTTALTECLYRSPVIARPRMGKGAHYFSYNYTKGFDWYRSQFPTESHAERMRRRTGYRLVAFDACPYYLFHPFAVDRIAEAMPSVKMLVMLRDPVARAHSHWVHSRASGHETLEFEEALAAEPGRLAGEVERMGADPGYYSSTHEHHSYLAKGLYAPQVARLLDRFPREQVLFVQAEAFYRAPNDEIRRVTDWLGVPPMTLEQGDNRNGYDYSPLSPELLDRLVEHFGESNEELFGLLGERYDWLS